MTGYVRQDTSNNISNGSVIDADDLDLEFNAVEAAFNSSTGHNHDGTSGEGSPITVVGPAQDIVTTSSQMAPKTDDTYDLGSATNKWKDLYVDGVAYVDAINLNGTAITSTATELNLLDGVTATTAELNILDGVTATAAELNTLDGITATVTELNYTDGVTSAIQTQLDNKQPLDAGLTSIAGLTTTADRMIYTTASDTYAVATLTSAGRALLDDASAAAQLITLGLTATAAELNTLDGITATVSELNILDGVTATAAELNTLDGITATVTELNYVDGVTSSIQTQLDAKQPLDSDLTAVSNLATTGIVVRTGTGTAATRAVAAGTGLTVSNGTGVSGNPTLSADIASQAEAEAGTSSTKLMTPQRVSQARQATLRVYEEQSSGVASSQSLTSASWNTRVLNATDGSISGASLSSNLVTLPAGTYFVEAWGLGYRVNSAKMRLRDVTNSQTLIVGQNAYSAAASDARTVIRPRLAGTFTLASTAEVSLEQYVGTTGLAIPVVSSGEPEIYADMIITKL